MSIRWDEEHEILAGRHCENAASEYSGDRRCRTWHDQCGCPDGRIHPQSWNGCKGIILNHYSGGAMQEDNEK